MWVLLLLQLLKTKFTSLIADKIFKIQMIDKLPPLQVPRMGIIIGLETIFIKELRGLSKLNYQKTNRVFTKFKNYSWIMVPLIAIGGMYIPKLGLLLIPIMLTLIVLGFLKGKYWCGNLCPHGSLFDKFLLPLSPNGKIPSFLTSKYTKAAFFIFYMVMFSSRLLKAFASWGSMTFLDRLGFVFAANYLIPTIVGISLALFVNPRSWCAFCPMGTMEQLACTTP
jgi:polyferredoxin